MAARFSYDDELASGIVGSEVAAKLGIIADGEWVDIKRRRDVWKDRCYVAEGKRTQLAVCERFRSPFGMLSS